MSETTPQTASAEPVAGLPSPPADSLVPPAPVTSLQPGSPAMFVQQLHFEPLRNLTTLSVSATGVGATVALLLLAQFI